MVLAECGSVLKLYLLILFVYSFLLYVFLFTIFLFFLVLVGLELSDGDSASQRTHRESDEKPRRAERDDGTTIKKIHEVDDARYPEIRTLI